MRSGNRVLLVALVLVVSVAAFPTLALGIHVTGNPEVQILAPQEGQSVSSLGVRLEISVSNFTLDEAAIDGPPEANHGHYHVYVNDAFTGLLTADPIVDDHDRGDPGSGWSRCYGGRRSSLPESDFRRPLSGSHHDQFFGELRRQSTRE